MVTKRRSGMRASLALLAVLALGVVAMSHSVEAPRPSASIAALTRSTTVAVHDRSASLRGLAAQPADAPVSEEVLERAASMRQGTEVEQRNVAAQPGLPDAGEAEQTRSARARRSSAAISFDNGLNGGSTSDNNIARRARLDRRDAQLAVQGDEQDRRHAPGPGQQQQHLRGHQRGPAGGADRLHERRRAPTASTTTAPSRSRSRAGRTTPRRASRRRSRAATSSSR